MRPWRIYFVWRWKKVKNNEMQKYSRSKPQRSVSYHKKWYIIWYIIWYKHIDIAKSTIWIYIMSILYDIIWYIDIISYHMTWYDIIWSHEFSCVASWVAHAWARVSQSWWKQWLSPLATQYLPRMGVVQLCTTLKTDISIENTLCGVSSGA